MTTATPVKISRSMRDALADIDRALDAVQHVRPQTLLALYRRDLISKPVNSDGTYRYTIVSQEGRAAMARFDEENAPPAVTCSWFALCDNDAVTAQPHPILGDVPICKRCADKVAALA